MFDSTQKKKQISNTGFRGFSASNKGQQEGSTLESLGKPVLIVYRTSTIPSLVIDGFFFIPI